jgi:hypothetical protein
MQHFKIQQFPNHRLNIVNPGITKLNHFITICANQVVMLAKSIGLLILSKIFTKLMLADKVTFHKDIQRIVNRRSANPVIFIFHADI